jgi:hypothetical protein
MRMFLMVLALLAVGCATAAKRPAKELPPCVMDVSTWGDDCSWDEGGKGSER